MEYLENVKEIEFYKEYTELTYGKYIERYEKDANSAKPTQLEYALCVYFPLIVIVAAFITWIYSAPSLLIAYLLILGGVWFPAAFVYVTRYRTIDFPAPVEKFRIKNMRRSNELGRRVDSFNKGLRSQKTAVKLLADRNNLDGGLTEFWAKQRELLQLEVDKFLTELKTVTDACPPKYPYGRKSLGTDKFYEKIGVLRTLEDSLAQLDNGTYEDTKDLSALASAALLRSELEDQRVVLGLPENTLPPPAKSARLLCNK